jgi:ornithine cyclodeaminase/alanine dehydrogenase-like protein (mu-crystallin family)
MTVLVLRAADLAKGCPMGDAISAVGAGFAALSSGQATVPLRPAVPLLDGGVALSMPAALAGASCYSVKVVTVAPGNPAAGLPTVQAAILLGDARTGTVLALIDGTALTALRTGAAGGVAARELSRPASSRAALFGAGAQARTQLLALAAVRPITDVRVVTREPAHARAFVEWSLAIPELRGMAIRGCAARDAVEDADIVVTATSSRTPVFEGGWLAAGTHVTAVGSYTPEMRELDDETLRGARIVVDQRAPALAESGELHGRRPEDVVEIGDIVARRIPGRTNDRERTIFKSVGNAIQDLVVATLAYERARALGLGTELAFP